MLLNRLTYFR